MFFAIGRTCKGLGITDDSPAYLLQYLLAVADCLPDLILRRVGAIKMDVMSVIFEQSLLA